MATPADQRLLDLLEKWLKSLELHARYAALDPESYARVQAWPDHERPSRWIIDLATQKAGALHEKLRERMAAGDGTFSDSLELMAFLAHLLGSEHIERFIPLADPQAQHAASDAAPGAQMGDSESNGTREMPALAHAPGRTGRAAVPAPTPPAAPAPKRDPGSKTDARPPAQAAGRAPPTRPAAPAERRAQAAPPAVSAGFPEAMVEQVIADATRLVQWGRKWYELAELISSMADRPALTDVRRILKDNKTVIDMKAGRG